MRAPRLLITSGEPAGVGPDLIAQLALEPWPAELLVVGDPDLLKARAEALNLSLNHLKIIPVVLKAPCKAGVLNPENSAYVLACLELAHEMASKKEVDAIVTAPVHKGVLNEAGFPFKGHTEFFAQKSGLESAVMLFVTPEAKVALATTHLPLSAVSKAITAERLSHHLKILHQSLITTFAIPNPKILVCGLNPHAGENGYLGREEIEVITPALDKLRQEGMDIVGPLPADTIFTEKYLKDADAILGLYHDQVLPVVKYMGFGNAVNVTLGLPYIRTSVDHGTALDVAGTLKADAESLKAALQLALDLSLRSHS